MITKDLIDYIKKQRNKGIPRDTISEKLMKAGWKAQDLTEAFTQVSNIISKEKSSISSKPTIVSLPADLKESSNTKKRTKRYPLAGYWIRAGAFVLDLFFLFIYIQIFYQIVTILTYFFIVDSSQELLDFLTIFGVFSYFIIFQWLFSGTIGQRMYGVKIVDRQKLNDLGFWRAVGMNTPYLIFTIVFTQLFKAMELEGWGYFLVGLFFFFSTFAIVGRSKRALHNRIVKTVAVRTPRKMRGPIFLTSIILTLFISITTIGFFYDEYDEFPDKTAKVLRNLEDFTYDLEKDFEDKLDNTEKSDSYDVKVSSSQNTSLTATEIYENNKEKIVIIMTSPQALGSGFFISEDGLIVTNYHVIDGAESVAVATYDGKEYEVEEVIDYSKEKDLAILKIKDNDKKFPFVNIHNRGDEIELGTKATAIGHPLGINYAITQGIVSGVHEFDDIEHIQFDAPISGGNSGGPVFNEKGEVIAVSSFSFVFGEDVNFGVYIGEIFDLKYGNIDVK